MLRICCVQSGPTLSCLIGLCCKYDVIYKTRNTLYITTLPEEDWAMATGNRDRKFGEDRLCSSRDMLADWQTNMVITSLLPCWGQSNNCQRHESMVAILICLLHSTERKLYMPNLCSHKCFDMVDWVTVNANSPTKRVQLAKDGHLAQFESSKQHWVDEWSYKNKRCDICAVLCVCFQGIVGHELHH